MTRSMILTATTVPGDPVKIRREDLGLRVPKYVDGSPVEACTTWLVVYDCRNARGMPPNPDNLDQCQDYAQVELLSMQRAGGDHHATRMRLTAEAAVLIQMGINVASIRDENGFNIYETLK